MSVLGRRTMGIPTVLIHEADGLIVTVEMLSGIIYQGYLEESEDTWNLKLMNVTCFLTDGTQISLEKIYLRGSQILFIILPDIYLFLIDVIN